MKKIIILTPLIILALVISVIVAHMLTGGYPDISIKKSPISFLIATTLESSENSSKLPIEGLNYNLGPIKYFDNNSWLVVPIVTINNNANNALIVINNYNGAYKVVLGPGSDFSGELAKVPANVAAYLENEGS